MSSNHGTPRGPSTWCDSCQALWILGPIASTLCWSPQPWSSWPCAKYTRRLCQTASRITLMTTGHRDNCSQMSHRERIAYLHERVARRRVLVVNAAEVREPVLAHALVVIQHDVRVVHLSRCVVPPPGVRVDCCRCVCVCVCCDQFRCVLPVFRRTWKRWMQVRTSLHPFFACPVRRGPVEGSKREGYHGFIPERQAVSVGLTTEDAVHIRPQLSEVEAC